MVHVHIFVSIYGITSIKQHANSGSVCVCMAWSGNIQGCTLGYMFSESVWVSQEVFLSFCFIPSKNIVIIVTSYTECYMKPDELSCILVASRAYLRKY
jgi:hypothetical protein